MVIKNLLFALIIGVLIMSCSKFSDWQPAESPLKTRWTKDVSPQNVWPEYPRPIMERNEWKNLNGKTFTSNQAQGFDRATMASMLGYGDEHSRLNSMTPTIDPEGNPMNVNLEGTAIGDALTKDYSQLMKAMNAKKGK